MLKAAKFGETRCRVKKIVVFLLSLILTLAAGCADNTAKNPPQEELLNTLPESEQGANAAGTVPQGSATQEMIGLANFEFHLWNRLDGSTATIPLTTAIAANLEEMTPEEARMLITHNTTHDAYMNLFNGSADLIFVTYPSEHEFGIAAQNQIGLEIIPVVKE